MHPEWYCDIVSLTNKQAKMHNNLSTDTNVLELENLNLKAQNESLLSSILELRNKLNQKDELLVSKEDLIIQLHHKLKMAYAYKYARRSERYDDPRQLKLFDYSEWEAKQDLVKDEEEALEIKEEDSSNKEKDDVVKLKKKTGRKKIPSYLPREEVICKLPESELTTEEGYSFTKIGEEVSEHLEVIPASIKVMKIIRYKYACKEREELGVKIAPNLSNQAIPKSIAGNGMVSHMLVQKYCHHLPLYRQEQIWKNLDIDISRSSMCNWISKSSKLFKLMIPLIKKEILSSGYIHADETPVTVLDYKDVDLERIKLENLDLKKTSRSYMWVYGNSLNKLVLFDYRQSRSGKHAYEFLYGFKGYLQADAYSGYDKIYGSEVIEVGCMAHARRKFSDILKISKNHTHANYACKEIQKLYNIERVLKDLEEKEDIGFDEIRSIRSKKSRPILEDLFEWMNEIFLKTPAKGSLGLAISYCLKNKDALMRYLDQGYLNIDNNFAERSIRPFAIGRKNWLFSGNHEAAEDSAIIYTLIESAKAYNIKPYDYLKYLLDNIKENMKDEDLRKLLPNNITNLHAFN